MSFGELGVGLERDAVFVLPSHTGLEKVQVLSALPHQNHSEDNTILLPYKP